MNVSVILGHPYDGSFNAAIAQTVVQTLEEDGHAVAFHDLHAEGFNPVIPPSELVSDVPADDLTAAFVNRYISVATLPAAGDLTGRQWLLIGGCFGLIAVVAGIIVSIWSGKKRLY